MIKRIDLFMPPRSRYHVLQAFTKSLSEALNRNGVRTRILESEKEDPKHFLDTLFADPPDCTLSFNGLLPDAEGRFFCDLINIPHVAYVVDPPQHFVSLTKSKLSIIASIDSFFCDFFRGLNFNNSIFMPHAVDRDLIREPNPLGKERNIDVLMLSSFIDFEAIRQEWKQRLAPGLFEVVNNAAEIVLSDRQTPCYLAIAQALDEHLKKSPEIDPVTIDFLSLLDQLEDYVNGKDRLDVIKSIKSANVHIFGSGSEKWKKALKNSKNISVNEPVSFEQALELMNRSKIVLNSHAGIKDGAHERIFAGIASGAAIMTRDNLFMHRYFTQNEDILLYRSGQWEEVDAQIHACLNDAGKRYEIIKNAQTVVRAGHTWDHRAVSLISELTPILEKLQTSSKKPKIEHHEK